VVGWVGAEAAGRDRDVVIELRGAVMASPSTVVARSVQDCDRWLAVLRLSARRGSVLDRELARLRIDEVLDRRLELERGKRSR
jgi:hypothetical protein